MLHPGLGEERYDAMICVPIVSRADRLIGVVSVWSPAADHFTGEHVRLAEWIAVVVASAIENAQLHASVSRRTRVLERMAELSAMTTSGLPAPRVLHLITELACEVAAADLAVMLVRDPSGTDRLILKSVGTVRADGAEQLQAARRELLAVDAEVRRRGLAWHAAAEDVRARLARWFDAAATAALRVAGEDLGLLACYRVGGRGFAAEDQALLQTIAGQAALALKNALLAEELVQHNELAHLLRDVVAGRLSTGTLRERAALLGLAARGLAVVVGSVDYEPHGEPDWEGSTLALRRIAQAVGERLAGARCTVSGDQVIALVPSTPGDGGGLQAIRAELAELRARRCGSGPARSSRSASRRRSTRSREPRGALAEAREAVAVGSGMAAAGGGVFALEDVGHHLLLSRAADLASVRDRYSVAVQQIAEYDRVKRAALVATLAVFLDVRNRNEAARALYVHRNTLAQRLARIEWLTGLDLSSSEEWFPLQLALRIHQVRTAKAAR